MSDNMTHTELVQAMAQQPQDDAEREQVIHDLRRDTEPSLFEVLTDDYEFAVRQAGDLGGAEVWVGYFPN